MDRGAWPCFVDGVTCLVNSVSVCEEKKKRERMKEKRREKMKGRMKEKMKRREKKEKMIFFKKNVSEPSNPPDELAQNVSKKNPRRTNYSSIFSAKVQNPAVFFIYLHDSNSIFRAAGINSEWVSGCTVLGSKVARQPQEEVARQYHAKWKKNEPFSEDQC